MATQRHIPPKGPQTLRDRAEALWKRRYRDLPAAPDDLVRIVHELQVHKIELELQNEELRAAQMQLEESRGQLADLYDFAPVGYLTIDESTLIQAANLRVATMLGVERSHLVGKRFNSFVERQSQDALYLGLRDTSRFWSGEIVLRSADGALFPVSVATIRVAEGVRSWRCVVTDITARQAAERALLESETLRASEERYRGLAEQVVDGIFVTDAEGRYIDANQAACDLLGYTLEELKARSVIDVIPPEEMPRLPEQFRRLQDGEIVRNEWRLKRKNGSVFVGELVGRQLADGRLQAVVRDVTERKEAEEVQRRLQQIAMLPVAGTLDETLGAIVETAMLIAHADFGTIQLLRPGTSALGFVAQRGFPQWWVDYWQDVPNGRGVCGAAVKAGDRVIVEDVEQSPIFTATDLEMQRRAGVRAVQSTPLVSRSGKLIGQLSTHFTTPHRPDDRTLRRLDLLAHQATDIIVQAQAETELKRQAALLDLSHDAIFVFDRDDRITYWNDGAARCYGWSKTEALGKVSHTLLQTQFPESLEAILETLTAKLHWEGELVHTRRDGRRIVVESRWTLQRGDTAEDVRVLEINKDITERRRLEHERAEETQRKDEFLAFLGHELRNPLAAIDLALQVVVGGASPSQRARMEDIIRRQTAVMRRLVDDLLELERISHGHVELTLGHLDLGESLQRAAAAIQTTVADRNQELRLGLPSGPVSFVADSARFDQIVGNLLSNASKYTDRGGRIELSGAREGSEVVIRCKDNGQGILPEDQGKIFEPFTRGRKTELGFGEASVGLGLALVKQLTELHGGTIAVESCGAGLGSEFTVRLPIVAPPSVPAVTAQPERARLTHRPRSIVIVEDNPSVAVALEALLEQAGHTVHVFADGASALASVSTLHPDALVIDIGLPGIDGYELLAKLKQLEGTKHALSVAVSGLKRRERAGPDGDMFDHYFNKPVDVPALLALFEQD